MGKFLTIRQTAATGILTEHRIRLMVAAGECPGIRAGNRFLDRAHDLLAIRDEHIRMSSWRQLVHEADEVITASVLGMQLGPAAIEGAQKAFRFNSCVHADLFCRIPLDELKSWEV